MKILFNKNEYDVPRGTKIGDLPFVEKQCGGKGICGKCKVKASGFLSPLSDNEKRLLSPKEIAEGIRLACETVIFGEAEIESRQSLDAQIVTEGIMPDYELEPRFKNYGVSIDIGTTTVASRLYDSKGTLLMEETCLNPQIAVGADVVTRMEHALAGEDTRLREMILECIDGILQKFLMTAESIDGIVICGNTVMLSFLTGTNVYSMSRAPFTAQSLFGETVSAGELGLKSIKPETEIYLSKCISAFVGGDVSCAILASGMLKRQNAFLVDMGTNGEMALWNNGELTVCSTAAGPVFEGAGIKNGMRAEKGAISRVKLKDNEMFVKVIGDVEPVGICGGGLIDAVSCLIEKGDLDESGYMDEDRKIASDVEVTRGDIRNVQLAKSAIRAGIEALLSHKKISARDIEVFKISGGFGKHLDIKNAISIGLLPENICAEAIGNGALAGASALLLDKKMSDHFENAKTLELAGNPVFVDKYMEHMLF